MDMEDVQYEALRKNWKAIVKDLDPNDVLDELYSKEVITKTEYEEVKNFLGTPKDKCNHLLDLISTKNGDQFNKFLDSLRSNHNWLYDAIIKTRDCPDLAAELDDSSYWKAAVQGNFPKLPTHYVDRTSELQELKQSLSNLRLGQTLVLHGMVLSGKSSLVAAALRDRKLLKTAFNNKVIWVDLGEIRNEVEDKDKIILELYKLYVSMGGEHAIDLFNDANENYAKIYQMQAALKKVIISDEYKNSLLILDDLRTKGVLNYFDIGCKILTTTSDLNFVCRNDSVKKITMSTGFTEKETQKLFEKCLNASVNNLHDEIKQMHTICKGHPILIALIGSVLEDHRERALKSGEFWDKINSKLRNSYKELNSDVGERLSSTLKMCIDNLKEYQKSYESLVVFAEDVNITTRVLEILWDKDEFSVQKIMKQLEKKSLVMCFFNKQLDVYVYGIHHLLLAELRKTVNDVDHLHRKLIEACDKIVFEGDINDLKKDNYILQYYGYHLEKSEMFEKFDIFFNLQFLAAKIKIVGCADLLKDFQIYRKYITKADEILESKVQEYEVFIKQYGHILQKYPYVDIVQCGLLQPVESYIYKIASEMACQNPEKMFINLKLSPDKHYFTHILELPYVITAACFTSDPDHVLVGTENGDIIMWEQPYKRQLRKFVDHKKKITRLMLSPNGSHFMSVSEDGYVKLWKLSSNTPRNSLGTLSTCFGSNENIPSPSLKQSSYYNFSYTDIKINQCQTFRNRDVSDDKLISATFANDFANTKIIATGSQRGKISVWYAASADTERLIFSISPSGTPANSLVFAHDDSAIFFNKDNNIVKYNMRGEYEMQFTDFCEIKSLLIVTEPSLALQHGLIAVSDNRITLWKWNTDSHPHKKDRVIANLGSGDLHFTCAAITKDCCYVAAGCSDLYLRTWAVDSECSDCIIEKYNEGNVVCLDTFLNDNHNSQFHVLLVGSNDNTVKQWHVHDSLTDIVPIKNLPIYDTFWSKFNNTPRIAILNTENKIQILNGYMLFVETDKIESVVKIICFSKDGDTIFYGLEDGRVFEFCVKTRTSAHILSLEAPVILLQCFEEHVVVASAENGYLMLYKDQKQICLRGTHTQEKKIFNLVPAVEVFYLSRVKKLLTVGRNRTVTVWNVDNGFCTVLLGSFGNPKDNVMSCCLSPNETFLCILAENMFYLYRLLYSTDYVDLELAENKNVDGSLRCCCFSSDEGLIAIGKRDGTIDIRDLKSRKVTTTLKLHTTPVNHVVFSPTSDDILVSLSEQIAWWNIKKCSSHTSAFNSLSNKVVPKKMNLLRQLSSLTLWDSKECHNANQCLLSTIKLVGSYGECVSASPNFDSFVTVDNIGKVYILEVMNNL